MARTKGARDIGPRKNSTVGPVGHCCDPFGAPKKARRDANVLKYWGKGLKKEEK